MASGRKFNLPQRNLHHFRHCHLHRRPSEPSGGPHFPKLRAVYWLRPKTIQTNNPSATQIKLTFFKIQNYSLNRRWSFLFSFTRQRQSLQSINFKLIILIALKMRRITEAAQMTRHTTNTDTFISENEPKQFRCPVHSQPQKILAPFMQMRLLGWCHHLLWRVIVCEAY